MRLLLVLCVSGAVAGCSTAGDRAGGATIAPAAGRSDGVAVRVQGQSYFCRGPTGGAPRQKLENGMVQVLLGRTSVAAAGQAAGYSCFKT